MTNKDITKIYFQGNEIVALYQGSTLIFKKTEDVPTGKYIVRGTLKPDSTARNIQLCVNGQREQFDVKSDKTFEHTFVNVPVTNMEYFTLACKDELNTLDLSEFDTSQVTSMVDLFYQCSNLETIDLTNVYTSNVTDMTRMFGICSGLKSLDVSRFDTSKVTNMSGMFFYDANLKSLDVSNFDTSKVTSMEDMFNGCESLTSLDLSNFDTSNVTQMGHMFRGCENLKSLDLSNFDTSKVTRLQYMFYDDEKLTDLYINFDVRSGTYFETTFSLCFSLKNVVGKFEGTKDNLYLDSCRSLTAQSAMVFINGLATVTEKRTLALKASTYDSLTPEQIAIATSKGWTVTRN